MIAIAGFSTHVAAMTTMDIPGLPRTAVTAVDHHAVSLIHGVEGHKAERDAGNHA